MQLTLKELTHLINGKLEGNQDVEVSQLMKIEEAIKGSVTFIANPKYIKYFETTEASAIIVADEFDLHGENGKNVIKVKDPYSAFGILQEVFKVQKKNRIGIDPKAIVHSSCIIGKDVYIGNGAVIEENCTLGDNVCIHSNTVISENSQIGANTIIYANCSIYDHSIIGSDCIIHANTVIGADGFGFAKEANGRYKKIEQNGNVVIGNEVEIGSNCSIDRASMGSTVISDGVKIDNLVQIAHNVFVGENTVIASQSGISGSTRIEKNCIIGGQVGLVGHISIAEGSMINAKSGVSKTISESNKKWNGAPAMDFTESLKLEALRRKLPIFEAKIKALEEQLIKANQ